jgi:hypothetical protein
MRPAGADRCRSPASMTPRIGCCGLLKAGWKWRLHMTMRIAKLDLAIQEEMRSGKTTAAWGRIVCALVALVALATGLISIAELGWSYRSYWGGLVFAPVLIVIGFLLLYAALFRWNRLTGESSPHRRRFRR